MAKRAHKPKTPSQGGTTNPKDWTPQGGFVLPVVGHVLNTSGWGMVDEIDMDAEFLPRVGTYNPIVQMVFYALFSVGNPAVPEVYLFAVPRDDADSPKVKRYERALRKPASITDFKNAFEKVTRAGFPPRSIRAYLVGMDDDTLDELVDDAATLWNSGELLKGKAENPTNVKAAIKTGAEVLRRQHGAALQKNKVIASQEIVLAPTKTPRSTTTFKLIEGAGSLVRAGSNPGGLRATQDHENSVRRAVGADLGNPVKEVRTGLVHVYFSTLWSLFHKFVLEAAQGPRWHVEDALKRPGVRTDYDTYWNNDEPEKHDAEEPYDPYKKHSNKDLYGDLRKFRTFRSKGPGKSKVVGSMRPSMGDIGTQIVTAATHERRWQDNHAILSKPPRLEQHKLRLVPVSPVDPIVETHDYRVLFGIYYDHPLMSPRENAQLYWYSNRSHFFSSAYQYAVMTGDKPHLAFLIYPKRGSRANIAISLAELKKDKSSEGILTAREIQKTLDSFDHQITQGKALYKVTLVKWLGPDAYVEQKDIPANPAKDSPENIDPEAWLAYLRWVRSTTKLKLGLNFAAALPKEWKSAETGRRKKLYYSQHENTAIRAKQLNQELTGERDDSNRAVEPWAVYIMEYLMAHKHHQTGTGWSYMVPLNVLRSKEVLPPRNTLKRIDKTQLLQWLQKMFPNFSVSKDNAGWIYIRSNPLLPFPYARILRRAAVQTTTELDKINAKLKSRGVKNFERTHLGYKMDGVEYDAYTMVVAMPPSVADTKLGLIHRKAISRRIIDDPQMVNRLRMGVRGTRRSFKEFGLTSVPIGMRFITTPHAKLKQSETDPIATGVIPRSTPLAAGHYTSAVGDSWKPIINNILQRSAAAVGSALAGYESNLSSDQKRRDIWAKYANDVRRLSKETERDIRHYVAALSRANLVANRPGYSKGRGPDIDQHIDTYVRYVRQEVTGTGKTIRIPEVVTRVGLGTYHAPFGSRAYRTTYLSVKAPSEDVAKLLILYRLLRRSAQNKAVGKVMNQRGIRTSRKLFPDENARILAQWAAARFVVVSDWDPKGVRRIPERTPDSTKELAVRRAAKHGEHTYAKLLRTD